MSIFITAEEAITLSKRTKTIFQQAFSDPKTEDDHLGNIMKEIWSKIHSSYSNDTITITNINNISDRNMSILKSLGYSVTMKERPSITGRFKHYWYEISWHQSVPVMTQIPKDSPVPVITQISNNAITEQQYVYTCGCGCCSEITSTQSVPVSNQTHNNGPHPIYGKKILSFGRSGDVGV
jgi:hypothetical protein